MIKFIFNIIITSLFVSSCQNTKIETSEGNFKLRSFNFTSDKEYFFNVKTKVIKSKKEIFYIYDFDKKKDTIKFWNNKVKYKGQNLSEIDTKNILFDGNMIAITKFYFADKNDFRKDKYLYVNKEIGIIFLTDSYGNMFEYDTEKKAILHKNIALNKLNSDCPFIVITL